MTEKIEYELPDEQAGFRRGRSTTDMLVALQVLIEKTIEMYGQVVVVFIDYSKAFDSISGLSKTHRRSTGIALQ